MLVNFKTILFAAVTLLFAGGAAAEALIATDPVSACNCPNNCSYTAGHSCKYKAGPSTSSSTVDGRCTESDDLKDYIDWYEYLLSRVPSENEDGTFIYHVQCLFYFVMDLHDGPLQQNHLSEIGPSTRAPYTWLSGWVIRYVKEIGKFMDSSDSVTADSIDTFFNSPSYHMEDYLVPEGGWKTFNEFFARHIHPERRPIDNPFSNKSIVSPADATFDGCFPVDDNGHCIIKSVPWPISVLLDEKTGNGMLFNEIFAGGQFCHSFLGPKDYHRQHAPVSGTVREARVIEGLCYLQVAAIEDKHGQWTIAPHRGVSDAACLETPPVLASPTSYVLDTPNEPGYQFIQARGIILIETPDIGFVAVLSVGMAHISSVVLSVKAGDKVVKGDEISYFQFGGSDVVMVFQKSAQVYFSKTQQKKHYKFGEKLAESGAATI